MSIFDALKYPFTGRGWAGNLLTAALLVMIPIIGWLILLGYGVRVTGVISRQRRQQPAWNQFGQDFARGITVSIGLGIYGLPVIALIIMLGIIGFLGGEELLFLASLCMVSLIFIYIMVVSPLFSSSIAWYSRTSDAIEFLNIPDRILDVSENIENVLLLWVHSAILLIFAIIPVGLIIFLLGLLFSNTVIALVLLLMLILPISISIAALALSSFHLTGQWGQLVVRKRT